MKSILAAGISGLLFGVGLCFAGMTNPEKVIGFLDFTGNWDPALLWVMVGAIGVHLPLRRIIGRRARPLCAPSFSIVPTKRIDAPLVIGAGLFGIGWGASGYCPAPAIASATTSSFAFIALCAMLVGFLVYRMSFGRVIPLAPSPGPLPLELCDTDP